MGSQAIHRLGTGTFRWHPPPVRILVHIPSQTLDVLDSHGVTPLLLAVSHDNAPLIALFLEHNASTLFPTERDGVSPYAPPPPQLEFELERREPFNLPTLSPDRFVRAPYTLAPLDATTRRQPHVAYALEPETVRLIRSARAPSPLSSVERALVSLTLDA